MKKMNLVYFLLIILIILSLSSVSAQVSCDENEDCLGGICTTIITDFKNILTDNITYPARLQKISALANVLKNYFLAVETYVGESCEVTVSEKGYCCIDNSLKVGSYNQNPCGGDEQNVESLLSRDIDSCKQLTLSKGYRYSTYYHTTPDFAILCTEPCSIDDEAFFQASFEGHILGVNALKEKVGYLPKEKMEFHLGRDGNCFVDGYGDHPTGHASSVEGHSLLCSPAYKWYLESQGTNWERDLNYYKGLESQTLTIHEPIHSIFADYMPEHTSGVPYKIQEAFCVGISLFAVGTITNYGDKLLVGNYSLDNPPPEGTPQIYHFFIYSLNQRYGFNEAEDTKEFFNKYKEMENIQINGTLKVKQILDDVLGTDTTASFNDIGISFD